MKFLYNAKNHIRYFIVRLLLDVLVSLAIPSSLSVLLLWIIGLPLKWFFEYHALFLIVLIPLLYLLGDIRAFWQQHKYERSSELCLQPKQSIVVEIMIPDNSYRTLYHIRLITGVKRTWKGIVVQGRITAEYIYDPEIGIYKSEELDRITIMPYFENTKGIEKSLRMLAHSKPTTQAGNPV